MTKYIGAAMLSLALFGCASVGNNRAPIAAADLRNIWNPMVGVGQYQNPPINADFPDPDIIRVGQDFFMATTTFANVPGVTILRSRDLIHWAYQGHVVDEIGGNPIYKLDGGNAYRHGLYAASLRHHGGKFYIAITPVDQHTRIYSSASIDGPWEMAILDRAAFDPGLFFDDDGKAYIFTSIGSDGTLTLLSLNDDLTAVTASRVINYNRGAEGSKVLRRNGYYYVFNSVPHGLALTVSRARSLDGPWETHAQIDDRSGGHQGAIVDMPDGTDYGFVMIDAGGIGRVTNISPIFWQDDWPVWGTPEAPNQVPARATAPLPIDDSNQMATSDEFSGGRLGSQWQWNHNPINSAWSLSARPGFLRLNATTATSFWTARNSLTQKGYGPISMATARLDISNIGAHDQCGLGTIGKYSGLALISGAANGGHMLSRRLVEDTTNGQMMTDEGAEIPIGGDYIYLSMRMDFTHSVAQGLGQLAYSLDNIHWSDLGGNFPIAFDWRTGTFQGPQYAIFCYGNGLNGGHLDIDWVRFTRP